MAPISLDTIAAKAFEDEMRLTFAETRILELKRQLSAEYERAKKAEIRADAAERANHTAGLGSMHTMRQQLLEASEQKETALAMRDKAMKEADLAKQKSIRLGEELRNVQSANDRLTNDLHEARNLRPTLDQTAVNQLHATITARDAKIEQLVEKYDRLTTEHFDARAHATRVCEENMSQQVKLEKQEAELNDLSAKLAEAESSRDNYQNDFQKLRIQNFKLGSLPQNANLSEENGKLNAEIQDLRKKIRDLKWDIGFYITDLDLAAADMRVFTCRHKRFSDIPDGEHSTREKNAELVAWDFFRDYQYDVEFVEQYNQARLFILKHHRAHEAVKQGRADWASNLKTELEKVDKSRGVTITYR